MDIELLTSTVVEFVAKVIPRLGKVGERLSDKALARLEGEVEERAAALWQRLEPRMEASILGAATTEKKIPDAVLLNELARQIHALLLEDQQFALEVSRLVDKAVHSPSIQQKARDNALQIGQVLGDAKLS